MNTFGNIGEFQAEKETWQLYVERLTQFYEANDVKALGKKRAILLTVCGAETFKLISSLVAPAKPGEKSFDELIKITNKHFHPTPSVIVERFKFYSKVRQPGQSVSQFVVELRHLTRHCEYGESLNDMLRDRFVCGINDERMQRRLLSESNLTFAKAMEIGQAMELATQNTKDIQQSYTSDVKAPIPLQQQEAHRVGGDKPNWKGRGRPQTHNQDQGKSGGLGRCYRCGRTDHTAQSCRARSYTCNSCGKQGHLAKVCRSSKATQIPSSEKPKYNSTYNIEETVPQDETSDMDSLPPHNYTLYKTTSHSKEPPLIVTLSINNTPVAMEIDTGASVSILSENTYETVFMGKKPPLSKDTEVELRTYTGQKIQVIGNCTVTVEHNFQKAELPLLVVAGKGPNLLGRNWLRHLKLAWHTIRHVDQTPSTASNITEQYSELFRDDLGQLKGQWVHISMRDDARPVFCKARPVPFAMKQQVNDELDRLEREGVIEQYLFSMGITHCTHYEGIG
jgi:hypothetical protein